MTPEELEALVGPVGKMGEYWWRVIGVLMRSGLTQDRVREMVGGHMRIASAELQVAAEELTRPVEQGGQGLSNRQAAAVLGVSPQTVGRSVPNGTRGTVTLGADGLSGVPNGTPPRVPAALAAPMLQLETHTGETVPYPQPQAPPTFNQTQGPGISWAKWSWNPVTGCLHGCDYCYAREIATSERTRAAFPVGFTPLFHHERLAAPLNTVLPAAHRDEDRPCEPDGCPWRRVFVCSMADLYGAWVPDHWIEQVHAAMLAAPDWQYILLTKFPGRYLRVQLPPNAWVGTSVDEQKRVRAAEDAFRAIRGARVKWLSLEPLLAPLQFADLSLFEWVVIGAQTRTVQPDGVGVVEAFAPPFEWVAQLVVQARAAGCKVHLKPNLLGAPGMLLPNEYPT